MMKQLEVQIMGHSYLLGCPEDGDARMLDAVSRVDIAMCKIRDAGKIKARDRIAVLAALNLAFELSDKTPAPAFVNTAPQLSGQPQTQPQLEGLLYRLDAALGFHSQLQTKNTTDGEQLKLRPSS